MNAYPESADYIVVPGAPSKSIQEWAVQKRLDFILSRLKQPPCRLLDIGCGEGVYLDALSSHSTNVVGIDLSVDHLNSAREHLAHPNTHLAHTKAQRLAFADNTFDAIILIETLEHLTAGPAVIAEIARVLRREGQLLISVPNKLFPIETHSIRVNGKVRGSRWGTGTPLLPLLPRCLRRRFATVRLYYTWELHKLLVESGLVVRYMGYLMPSVDSMERQLSAIPLTRYLRRLATWLERSPFRVFGSTILVEALKV
jgi:SAM-dependent methyltransferase